MNKLVIYTSPTCGPCKQLKPTLVEVAQANDIELEVVEASKDTEQEFIAKGIRAVPTVISYKDGYEIGRFTGGKTRTEVIKYLENWGMLVTQ